MPADNKYEMNSGGGVGADLTEADFKENKIICDSDNFNFLRYRYLKLKVSLKVKSTCCHETFQLAQSTSIVGL